MEDMSKEEIMARIQKYLKAAQDSVDSAEMKAEGLEMDDIGREPAVETNSRGPASAPVEDGMITRETLMENAEEDAIRKLMSGQTARDGRGREMEAEDLEPEKVDGYLKKRGFKVLEQMK